VVAQGMSSRAPVLNTCCEAIRSAGGCPTRRRHSREIQPIRRVPALQRKPTPEQIDDQSKAHLVPARHNHTVRRAALLLLLAWRAASPACRRLLNRRTHWRGEWSGRST
jgi:hypothetical protein